MYGSEKIDGNSLKGNYLKKILKLLKLLKLGKYAG